MWCIPYCTCYICVYHIYYTLFQSMHMHNRLQVIFKYCICVCVCVSISKYIYPSKIYFINQIISLGWCPSSINQIPNIPIPNCTPIPKSMLVASTQKCYKCIYCAWPNITYLCNGLDILDNIILNICVCVSGNANVNWMGVAIVIRLNGVRNFVFVLYDIQFINVYR